MVISHLNHYFENNKNPILEDKLKEERSQLETDETIKNGKNLLWNFKIEN